MNLVNALATRMHQEDAAQQVPTRSSAMEWEEVIETADDAVWTDVNGKEKYPPWAHNWKRLVIGLRVVRGTAGMQSVLRDLASMHSRMAQELYMEFKMKSGTTLTWQEFQRMDAARQKAETLAHAKPMKYNPACKREARTRSKATPKGGWKFEPKDCPHMPGSMDHPRNNQANSPWITCLDCGSRWGYVTTEPDLVENYLKMIMTGPSRDAFVKRWQELQPSEQTHLIEEYNELKRLTPKASCENIVKGWISCNYKRPEATDAITAFYVAILCRDHDYKGGKGKTRGSASGENAQAPQ